MVCGLRTAIMAEPNKIAITTQEVISTWACTWKPPICQYKCWPTSTPDISYNPFCVLIEHNRIFILPSERNRTVKQIILIRLSFFLTCLELSIFDTNLLH